MIAVVVVMEAGPRESADKAIDDGTATACVVTNDV